MFSFLISLITFYPSNVPGPVDHDLLIHLFIYLFILSPGALIGVPSQGKTRMKKRQTF